MFTPNDYAAPAFTIEVTQLESGQYQASSPGLTVPPSKGPTEGDAIRAHALAIHEALGRGDAFATTARSDA